MRKKIFILTRYSISLRKKAWLLSKQDSFEEYEKKLFDRVRLDDHFYFFSNYTLPSIISQRDVPDDLEVEHVVLTSSRLPSAAKNGLYDLSKCYSNLRVLEMSPEDDLNLAFHNYVRDNSSQDMVCATVRLDDDDLLHPNFFCYVYKYIVPSFEGVCVSFSRGVAVLYDSKAKSAISALSIDYPKCAQGLTYISRPSVKKNHVYMLGNHTKVDKFSKLLVDKSGLSYLRMCYQTQDTAELFYRQKEKEGDVVSIEDVEREFLVNL